MDGMITYPAIARRHNLQPQTIFAKDSLPAISRLEEMSYIRIEHLPSGTAFEFAEMDEADQQRWMERVLILFPVDQHPGQAGETRMVDKNAASGYNDN